MYNEKNGLLRFAQHYSSVPTLAAAKNEGNFPPNGEQIETLGALDGQLYDVGADG